MIDNRIGPVYTSGPIGAGKTTLADRLQQKLAQDPERYKVTYLLIPPRLTVNSFLHLVMEEFAIKTHNSYVRNLEYLAAWLREQHQLQLGGRRGSSGPARERPTSANKQNVPQT